MTNRPLTRNDVIAATLIWALVLIGLTRRPEPEVQRADVSCVHRGG